MTTVRWRRRVSMTAALILLPLSALAASVPAHAASGCASHLASDFNGDGYADVATGIGDGDTPGSVQINYGSPSGLVTATAQTFAPTSSGMPDPGNGEGFGTNVVTGNYNGDCYADLAIAVPFFTDSTHLDTGEITVLFGSATGLRTSGATQIFGPGTESEFGRAMASGDINHDGYADLVAGAPEPDTGTGEVGVVYGSATGVHGTPTWISETSAAVPGATAHDTGFGDAVAAGDFDGDGYADLAIGVPGWDSSTTKNSGAVVTLRGGSSGVASTGATVITQATPGVPGADENGDGLGSVLATGDVNGDARADLVIGVPDESIGSLAEAGDIVYLPGTSAGITGAGAASFSLHTPGIPGVAKSAAFAGSSVALGDVDNDGYADIVFGLPFDRIGSIEGGTIVVLRGGATGPTVTGAKILSQVTGGVPGTPEAGDEFGSAVGVAAITGSGPQDVIAGAPGEDSPTQSGYVVVMPDVPGSGVTGAGSKIIPWTPGSTTTGNGSNGFGSSLA